MVSAQALPEGVRLISGPGCPVCVTPQRQIDHFLALGLVPNAVLATFGDMLRVPGSEYTLEQARAAGTEVLITYSPMDAVAAAERHPDREIIFFGIGFETTAPAVALAIQEAKARGLRNFSVLSAHKTIPPALAALIAGDLKVDGFLCPGHVSVIIGSDAYRPTAAAGKPCVVAGFEPADILRSLEMLLRQLRRRPLRGRSRVLPRRAPRGESQGTGADGPHLPRRRCRLARHRRHSRAAASNCRKTSPTSTPRGVSR